MFTERFNLMRNLLFFLLLTAMFAGCATVDQPLPEQWLAGDHHVHSQYSGEMDRSVEPPVYRIGVHGTYSMPHNARMAVEHGLSWIVSTDHGGRFHARMVLDQAYPEFLQAREEVPELFNFFGFEMNTPGADHSSIIMPHTHDEATRVFDVETEFDRFREGRSEPDRNSTQKMIDALVEMKTFPQLPVVIANHPSRQARSMDELGITTPAALRAWNNAAPEIAVGMVGAPGRQAATLNADGTANPENHRGRYGRLPTFGGFDVLTATVGGFWDSMLGEGRHWWITANSDSHRNWRDGGADFWPGEFSKTFVFASKTYDDILTSLRNGKVFVTTGDLVSELYVRVTSESGNSADIGGTLHTGAGEKTVVRIRARDPGGPNHNGDEPAVNRIDLILGEISGVQSDLDHHSNTSTRVVKRFTSSDWSRDGEFLTMTAELPVGKDIYVRVRGTNTSQSEPTPDVAGENPWDDLWFYSNPVFVVVQ
jgi:hypothetical protein